MEVSLQGTLINNFKISQSNIPAIENCMLNYSVDITDNEKLYTAVRPVTEDDES